MKPKMIAGAIRKIISNSNPTIGIKKEYQRTRKANGYQLHKPTI
jgi:hypothetical protein